MITIEWISAGIGFLGGIALFLILAAFIKTLKKRKPQQSFQTVKDKLHEAYMGNHKSASSIKELYQIFSDIEKEGLQ